MNFHTTGSQALMNRYNSAQFTFPLFAGSKKKSQKNVQTPPQNQLTGKAQSSQSAPEVLQLSKTLVGVSLSDPLSVDTFQLSSPTQQSLIQDFLNKALTSAAFLNGHGPMKQLAEHTLLTAKAMVSDPSVSAPKRLETIQELVCELYGPDKSREDLIQFLHMVNVPVLEAEEHPWLQGYFETQPSVAQMTIPSTLLGRKSGGQPSKAVKGSEGTPELIELIKTLNNEKGLRILASSKTSQARESAAGHNFALHDLRHEGLHVFQFIMGLPFVGKSQEADYKAKQLEQNFARQFNSDPASVASHKEREEKERYQQKLIGELFDEALKEERPILDRYREARAELEKVMGEDEVFQSQLVFMKSNAERQKALKSQQYKDINARIKAAQTAYVNADKACQVVMNSDKGKAYTRVLMLENQAASVPDGKEAYLEAVRKFFSFVDFNTPASGTSVGAAVRRLAHREMEVYGMLIDNKKRMGIDQQYNIINLDRWLSYKVLEMQSRKFDGIVLPETEA